MLVGAVGSIIIALVAGGIIHFPSSDGNASLSTPFVSPAAQSIHLPPNLSISKTNVFGLKVTVTGQAISQSGGQITKIHFDWGDGKAANAASFPMSHNYANPGTYDITITAYDRMLSTTKTMPIIIKGVTQCDFSPSSY